MHTTLIVALLAVGVAGALRPPGHLPLAAFPVLAALVALMSGSVTAHAARGALDALVEPLAFLLLAVPLAALLDELAVFDTAAQLVAGKRVAVGCWALGCVVVAVLNLDAAVVLLTPLYIRLARRLVLDPVAFGFQPALLACLASCALPVSNLTNLIAVHERHLNAHDFTSALALPSVVAVVVGYFGWRIAFRGAALVPAGPTPAESPARRPLVIGVCVLAALVVGFLFGDRVGLAPWGVVAIVDIVLVFVARSLPWRSTPVDAAAVAAALAVLAAGVAAHLDVGRLLSNHTGTAAIMRDAGVTAVLANACNNLPAFLVLFPFAVRRSSDAQWAVLLGANLGPLLLVTGSLSGLLWLTVARREELAVGPVAYLRVGLIAGVPAFVLATTAFALTR
ncbi:MAG: Citrate transporter [Actinomycetia bacterium]|nr:Citrate transporter [Actinomycetes bacterium]